MLCVMCKKNPVRGHEPYADWCKNCSFSLLCSSACTPVTIQDIPEWLASLRRRVKNKT